MAESIAVYFKDAKETELRATLSEIALEWKDEDRWVYPPVEDNDVLVYEYKTLLSEFEDDDLVKLNTLGWQPTTILCIEMRRSKGKQGIDSAAALAVRLLARFEGVVDDLWSPSHLWSLDEIERGTEKDGKTFLDCYRDRLRR